MTAALLLVVAALLVVPRRRVTPGRRTARAVRLPLPLLAGIAVAVTTVLTVGGGTGLIAGLPIGGAAAYGVVVLQRRPVAPVTPPCLPVALDLLAAALRAGATPVSALRSVAGACASSDPQVHAVLTRVASLLSLGAPPADAWSTALAKQAAAADVPAWQWVAATSARSADSGVRLAESWQRLAADLRAEARTAALARVERSAVWALLPLGACFLPAFVCLGIVPVIAGVVSQVVRR